MCGAYLFETQWKIYMPQKTYFSKISVAYRNFSFKVIHVSICPLLLLFR